MFDRRADYSPQYDNHTTEEYPPDWKNRRWKVLKRDGFTCQRCGVRSTRVDDIRFDVDHIVPKSDGGNHGLDNLQTLCPSCHTRKHPDNDHLRKRAREYKHRNQPSPLVRVTRTALRPLLALLGVASDDNTVLDDHGRRLQVQSLGRVNSLSEGQGVTVEAAVVELWDSGSDNIRQIGRMADASAQARFIIWSDNGHQRLREGRRYRLVGAETNSYNGEFQLVIDGQTAVQPLD